MVSNYDLNRTALNNQLMGLSTDTKPTTGVQPNSLFWELDTNGMYFFDGTEWQAIGEGGGGGGGGSVATVIYTTFYPYGTPSLDITAGELKQLLEDGADIWLSALTQFDDSETNRSRQKLVNWSYTTHDGEHYTFIFAGSGAFATYACTSADAKPEMQ